MLFIRAFAVPEAAGQAVIALEAIPAVAHVMRQATADGRLEMISADLPAAGVDRALEALSAVGLSPEHITVERPNAIGPIERRGRWLTFGREPLVWAEVVEGARENARLPPRYLIYMVVAGVLAGFAVIFANATLMVGAMAVSPDLLPVTAACVGIVGRRHRLFFRALGTLTIGLAVALLSAATLAYLLDASGYLAAHLPDGSGLVIAPSTRLLLPAITIAFVAGVAGMLAAETKASVAIGVAISVATIPSAAYCGVALAIGSINQAATGLGILTVNVAFLLIGGVVTLSVQRRLRARLDSGLER